MRNARVAAIDSPRRVDLTPAGREVLQTVMERDGKPTLHRAIMEVTQASGLRDVGRLNPGGRTGSV
jgi:hypothetical protein